MAKKDMNGAGINTLETMAVTMGDPVHISGATVELPTDDTPDAYRAADVDDDGMYDPANLRSEQHYEKAAAHKVITTIPVTKPRENWFVRSHRTLFMEGVSMIEWERENYLVMPDLAAMLRDTFPIHVYIVHLCIDRQDNLSYWPIKLPKADGRSNPWSESARRIAKIAETKWIRLKSNQVLGAYEHFEAASELPEPVWPDGDLKTFNKIAFKDRVITSFDHLVLKKLRGEE
jgi:hypothetical protein